MMAEGMGERPGELLTLRLGEGNLQAELGAEFRLVSLTE